MASPRVLLGAVLALALLPDATPFLPTPALARGCCHGSSPALACPARPPTRLAVVLRQGLALRAAKKEAAGAPQGGSGAADKVVQEPMPGKMEEKVLKVVDAMLKIGVPARMFVTPKGDLPVEMLMDAADALLDEDAYNKAIYRRAAQTQGEREEQTLEEVSASKSPAARSATAKHLSKSSDA
ncbi:hypothetical protein T484DRAFT_2027128 [Baffinella frigidus]|nr:hypothetical protein T484DRAFT_2027128 [Cryptophyta sp. CCMP2293]